MRSAHCRSKSSSRRVAVASGKSIETLQLFDERRPLQVEDLRSGGFVAASPFKRLADHLALDACDEQLEVDAVIRQREAIQKRLAFGGALDVRWQIRYLHLRPAAGQRHCALHRVLELPHVARPLICHQTS